MTNEQTLDYNLKLQNDIWLKNQKLDCRKIALQCAQNTDHANITTTLLENASEIYHWLVSEIIEPK